MRVDISIAPLTDPWERLEAACVAHLVALLTRSFRWEGFRGVEDLGGGLQASFGWVTSLLRLLGL